MNSFDKVIGYEDIKRELKLFADVIKNTDKYSLLGVTLPSGLLLSGDPGLGKTLMANCFIEEAGCKSFTIRKEKPNGDFVKYIREVFDMAAKESPSIVFLDDLDKFANEDCQHRDAEEYVTVQSCIDEYKGKGVFVLATVNEKEELPESLLRAGRFDETIDVKRPKGKDAERLIEYFLSRKKIMGNIDMEELVRMMEDYSCAEVETVINKAGIYACYEGRDKINQGDIIKSCMRLLFNSPECVNPDGDDNTRFVAIHEAGHAVVREILTPGSVTLLSVCRYIGSTEGITRVHEPHNYRHFKEANENNVRGVLGGKAATEIVLGLADMGSSSDLQKAFSMVKRFVDDCCTVGFETYEIDDTPSQHLREKKDILISTEMERYYSDAKRIIVEHRDFLDAIVDALMDHKTITLREMQDLRKKDVG